MKTEKCFRHCTVREQTVCPTAPHVAFTGIGAAFTDRRVMEPLEARLLISGGLASAALAVLFAFFPRLLAYPLAVLFVWIALAQLYRGYKLHRQGKRKKE